MNPWALASLGHDEVRNATALAGLWMPDFGGATSLRFAAAFLATAIPTVDWFMELAAGYRVATEVCPLGDRADRVDLIIETTHHLIGIEVKIRAGLGPDQLQRYSLAIARRAALQNLTPTVIFLALRPANVPAIASTSWINVARAARSAAGRKATERTFVQHLVATFGEHVQAF
ncbi:PD-(D/E)XK nuclease superfamily protein [Sphingomonas sp. NFR15]|nr:PD-(D/E)XK nuclease superfamily protein [Sphingomonas sp. NFR15]